jgi:hypothetical protein
MQSEVTSPDEDLNAGSGHLVGPTAFIGGVTMSSRRTRIVVAGIAALGIVGVALPASAEDTAVTFELTGGFLELSAHPTAATLTAGALTVGGKTVTGALGSTTVTDERGSLANSATVSMVSSVFSNGSTTIPAASVSGYSGVATPDSGVTVPTATLVPVSIGTAATILTMTSVGTGSATYNPTISVAVPSDATAGTYTGTVTQTAA